MDLHYLEFVTPDVDATCAALARSLGAEFGEPVAELGGARTATRPDGTEVGVRAPMHEDEDPVVRPYHRVDDLERALAAATESGGEVALEAMEIPGRGTIAIYVLGGIQHGLWQV
ncbi:hydroxylase [Halomonas denitrificans]|nr:hydroxylase [Halomonas denitrificans]